MASLDGLFQATLFLLRVILGGVLLMSGGTKLTNPRGFVANVRNYKLLPSPVATAYGWSLPYIEFATGGALLLGLLIPLAAAAALIMFLTFMVAVGAAIWRGQNLECSCFGLLYRERVGWSTQLRDSVLVIMSGFVLFGDNGAMSLEHLLANPLAFNSAIALVGETIVLILSVAVVYFNLRTGIQGRPKIGE